MFQHSPFIYVIKIKPDVEQLCLQLYSLSLFVVDVTVLTTGCNCRLKHLGDSVVWCYMPRCRV